ncbi:RNA-binding protein [Mycobacterium phage Bromden]|uniref:Ro-like RNA binding protein n=1 Tax=Mycobacterium phage Bromden TaxID=2283252 RepID=A0A345MBI9_9CAUD|nr:RNA-binding protein [Mycobacterium phage Bromden]AXH67860.1 Ro-like RNA binding protein [Mycobacterium phage Bromden]
MTTFLQSLQSQFNTTRTENGDKAHKSSLDPVVDYFGLAGAMRDRAEASADLLEKAFRVDPQAAVRTLFYLRDVRGGQGERDVFRAGLKRLLNKYPGLDWSVLKHVPFYGRWDDLFYDGATVTPPVARILHNQWAADVAAYERGDQVSLMAKWLPSDKSKSRPELAIAVRQALGLTQREYRQTLTALRGRIGLVEHDMSERTYEHIDYSKLPAQAHRKHVKAFRRNDGERYQAFLDAVQRGEAKVNTSTLYPYELFDLCRSDPQAADALWKNLPDYTQPGQDALVLPDVSGSMYGRPISVSVSLALYFAERNTGPYQGYFLSFDTTPKLVKVPESGDLAQKLSAVEYHTNNSGSTNLEAAFAAILRAGVQSGSVPGVLYVVSDMQFNQALNHADLSVFESAKLAFRSHGLELPHVVFWNVNARHDQLPATAMDGNVTLVSGLAATTFALAVEGKSPRELVDDVINSERYANIVL